MEQTPIPPVHPLRVRDRLPDFAVLFTLGLVMAAVGGGAVSLVWSVGFASSIGAALAILGAAVLLAGGLTGGNYAVYGVGRGASRYTYMQGDGNDAMLDEWRAGYRPEADLAAVLLVIAGLCYVAIGALILSSMT